MCNLSDLVEEEAREKALKEGHSQGLEEGELKAVDFAIVL